MAEAFIVAATRTASGRRNGRLSGWHPVDLAAQVINEVLARTGADPALVDDVILGCVGQAGEQSNNTARMAVLSSRLPVTVPGTTVDRQCGSSQQAVSFAAQAVMSGSMDCVIAGGIESMSRVPMMMPSDLPRKNGLGFYMGQTLQERYSGVELSQFTATELMVQKYGFAREQLDAFALRSHQRAIAATREGHFAKEIMAVPARRVAEEASGEAHTVDEGIRFDASIESIAGVKTMAPGGTITAANASQIADGASAVMIVNERGLKTLGVQPLARIHHMSVLGSDPVHMMETPVPATLHALKKTGMKIEDIDLYEVNEAFACVPLAWLQVLGADPERLNVWGGSIALGHPLGASGTRLMTTLVHAMHQRGARYGLQTMCEFAGTANVTILERL